MPSELFELYFNYVFILGIVVVLYIVMLPYIVMLSHIKFGSDHDFLRHNIIPCLHFYIHPFPHEQWLTLLCLPVSIKMSMQSIFTTGREPIDVLHKTNQLPPLPRCPRVLDENSYDRAYPGNNVQLPPLQQTHRGQNKLPVFFPDHKEMKSDSALRTALRKDQHGGSFVGYWDPERNFSHAASTGASTGASSPASSQASARVIGIAVAALLN